MNLDYRYLKLFFPVVLFMTSFDALGQTMSFVNFAPSTPKDSFSNNKSIALNTKGHVYVVDGGSQAVHVFDSLGVQIETIKTVATSNGNITLLSPTQMCIDKNNTLYIYDEELDKVIVKPIAGVGFSFGEKGSSIGQINDVLDITTDTEGYIYLLNGGRSQVDIFSPSGEYITWLGGAVNTFSDPIAIGINGRNDVYVLDKKECSIFIYDIGGNLINTHRTLSRKSGLSVSNVIDMAVIPNGDFFLLDEATGSTTHFDKIAVMQGKLGSQGNSAKSVFQQVMAITSGVCYGNAIAILDKAVNRTQIFTVATNIAPLIPAAKRMRLETRTTTHTPAVDMASAPNGNLYLIPINDKGVVVAYKDLTNNEAFAIRGKFDEAVAITTDSLSNIYVIDGGNDEIVMFDPKGTLIRKFGQQIPKRLKDPTGIVIQENGNIVVADHSNGNFHLWNNKGDYQRIITQAENSGIESPYKIQVDSKDQIFVWDNKANAIYRVASSGWPIALKQIKLRAEKSGDSPGEIGSFFVDPLDQIHVYNKTTTQLEVYEWDQEPILKFTIGKPGVGINAFEKVSNVLFEKATFNTYFVADGGSTQQVYQYQLKPPTPDNHFSYDVGDDGKLVVFFNKMKSRSVSSYALVTASATGEDSIAVRSNTASFLLSEKNINIQLLHYGLVSLSFTNASDPNTGFDNYLGYADRLLADAQYNEALSAYKTTLEKMGTSMKMKVYVSSKLSEAGRKLANAQEPVASLNYLQLAYSLTPNNEATKKAYTHSFKSYFQQLANRADYTEMVLEAERISTNLILKPMVLNAVDSVCLNMSQTPNENAINNAITIQKKLIEWDVRNPQFYGSLEASNYELYKFKRNSGLPAFEQEAALKEAEKYAHQAVERLKQSNLPHYSKQLLQLEILNAEEKYIDAEMIAFAEIGDLKMPAKMATLYRMQLAQAYSGQLKHNVATLEYQRILTEDPNNAQIKILMAQSLVAEKKYDAAKATYQEMLLSDRSNVNYIASIGKIELLNRNYSEASFQLEKACKLEPTNMTFYGPLAEAFEGSTNYQPAIDNYSLAIQFQESKLAQMKNGYGSASELREAQQQLNKYFSSYAKLNEQIGKFSDATKAYQKITASEPTNAEAYYGLGKSNLSNGLVYDAVSAFATANKLMPTNESYKTAHSNALKIRDKVSKNEPPLSIIDIQLKEIYPSMYRNYSDIKLLPIGMIVVSNNTALPLTPLSITVFVKELMNQPTQILSSTMVGFSNSKLELSAIFNEGILNHTADEKLQLEVVMKYIADGQEKLVSKSSTFVLHGRNAITWKDKRCLAAFISPSEEALIDYNKKADQIFKHEKTYSLNKQILKAMQIYTLLHHSNFVYSPDPVLSFATVSTNTDILDYLQYPAETLKRKSGDCDDLVTLFSSMLENAGIATAYIDVPGHVFMAFDSQVKPTEIVEAGLLATDVIIHQNKVWIPIETTLLGTNHFMNAWKSGSERYFKELNAGNFPEIVPLADARSIYTPSNYVPSGFQEEPPKDGGMMLEYNNMLTQLTVKTKKEVVAEIANRYQAETDNIFIKNKYAILLGQIGELDKSEKVLLEAFEIAPTNPSILNNLGNLYLLKNNMEQAINYYTQASVIDPEDAEICINICKAHLLSNNKKEAEIWYNKAIAQSTNLEVLYSNLKSQIK